MAAKKEKKLKPKEIEFAKKYVKNNKNGTKTAKEVYGITSDNYAGVKAHELLRNPKIESTIVKEEISLKKALIKQGITPDKIAEKVGVLLNAHTVKKDADGNEEMIKDYNAINNGLKHAKEIYGVEDSDKKTTNNTYQFFHNPVFQKNLQTYDQNFKDQLLKYQNAQTTETITEDVEAIE
jgi:hypothetical protein